MSKLISNLRGFRNYHKYLGLTLAFLLLISAVTGLLLGWKKNIGLLQPPTQKGTAQSLADWKTLEELAAVACDSFYALYPAEAGNPIDRMDIQPSKGIVKVLFEGGWWEVQVDGATAKVLSISRRHSDWIEALHDGSIVGDTFKLISMNALGFGLIFLILTGFWLWYGPRKIRKERRHR